MILYLGRAGEFQEAKDLLEKVAVEAGLENEKWGLRSVLGGGFREQG